ncbi:MAG TPA: M64 family metallopeptidase [Polyangiales bacterium]|nr:M64 family metallopeptidase [Polyangiales bacterium]
MIALSPLEANRAWLRWFSACALASAVACSSETPAAEPVQGAGAGGTSVVPAIAGASGSSGSQAAGAAAAPGSAAGSGGQSTGAAGSRAAGSGGRGGREPSAGNGGGVAGSRSNGQAGAAAGSGGTGGSSPTVPTGPSTPLDCGMNGVAIENAGPPKNRVNYVIVGDGYTTAQQDLFVQHVQKAMTKRFSEVIGQPYGRYRKFVNICAIKLVSQSGPIGSGSTALECTGDDQSRLARCNSSKVNMAIMSNVPASFEVDWKAVVLNNDRWWNTGAVIMLWSGAHKDAAGAALHEGGHGFHQLADEYDGTDTNCNREFGEVNVTADAMMTAGKWDMWLGYDQAGATGVQGAVAGARYCKSGQYRPSQNSMMNQLFGDKPNTSYNPVSREKMIMDIWRAVTPIDETVPPPGQLSAAGKLELKVIDPAVIDVDWSIDGEVVAAKGGPTLDLATRNLSSGKHTITAKAYDNAGMDLVRYRSGTQYGRMNWARSQQTVSWTLDVP